MRYLQNLRWFIKSKCIIFIPYENGHYFLAYLCRVAFTNKIFQEGDQYKAKIFFMAQKFKFYVCQVKPIFLDV